MPCKYTVHISTHSFSDQNYSSFNPTYFRKRSLKFVFNSIRTCCDIIRPLSAYLRYLCRMNRIIKAIPEPLHNSQTGLFERGTSAVKHIFRNSYKSLPSFTLLKEFYNGSALIKFLLLC